MKRWKIKDNRGGLSLNIRCTAECCNAQYFQRTSSEILALSQNPLRQRTRQAETPLGTVCCSVRCPQRIWTRSSAEDSGRYSTRITFDRFAQPHLHTASLRRNERVQRARDSGTHSPTSPRSFRHYARDGHQSRVVRTKRAFDQVTLQAGAP